MTLVLQIEPFVINTQIIIFGIIDDNNQFSMMLSFFPCFHGNCIHCCKWYNSLTSVGSFQDKNSHDKKIRKYVKNMF